MERKTNRTNLEIFKFLRKSAESQGYSLCKKLAGIFPSIEIQ